MYEKPTQLFACVFAQSRAGQETIWHPSADVYRTPNGWLVKLDLAGVHPDDISVQVEGCTIHVSGIRRDWALEEGYTYYSMEIAYNRFARSIQLPCTMTNPRVHVQYRDGILIIRVDEES